MSGWGNASSFFASLTSGTSPKPSTIEPAVDANARTSPKIVAPRPSPGDMNTADSITGTVDIDDLFGPPKTEQTILQNPVPIATSNFAPRRPPRAAPKDGSAEVPEWLMAKVDDYITDHFYKLEAQLGKLQQQINDVALATQKREDRVSEVLTQTKMLIELQYAETKKNMARDSEMTSVVEQFELLKELVIEKQFARIEAVEGKFTNFGTELESYGEELMKKLDNKLRVRDDATYKFESDLASVKKSFTSLRLEFTKSKKAQDFKNTSTSVFFMKVIDMKPDERKKILRTLVEQEDKNRGAVEKAETDLKDHEKSKSDA